MASQSDAAFECSKCSFPCFRMVRFLACNHIICVDCVNDLIWEGDHEHFLCCIDPTCRICQTPTDIVAETHGAQIHTLHTIFEKRLEDDPKCSNNPKSKEADPITSNEADPKSNEADPKSNEADPKSNEAD